MPIRRTFVVVVPKGSIADIESLREAAWVLARTWSFRQSDHWDTDRGEEIVFGFENENVAVLFQGHCRKHGIPSCLQKEER